MSAVGGPFSAKPPGALDALLGESARIRRDNADFIRANFPELAGGIDTYEPQPSTPRPPLDAAERKVEYGAFLPKTRPRFDSPAAAASLAGVAVGTGAIYGGLFPPPASGGDAFSRYFGMGVEHRSQERLKNYEENLIDERIWDYDILEDYWQMRDDANNITERNRDERMRDERRAEDSRLARIAEERRAEEARHARLSTERRFANDYSFSDPE